MALAWSERGSLKGPPGDPGTPGTPGLGIESAEVNGSGDLIVTLTDDSQVNAGHVVGANGSSVNFENSVANVAALPNTPPLLSAYYVVADGHLYVYEGDDAADDGKAGYTDVGAIKGDTGDTGPSGTNGVSVTGAAIDGAGHLILTLSSGGPIDAGVAKGADGASGAPGSDGTDGTDGADGAAGPRGARIESFSGGTPPTITDQIVGDLALSETDGTLYRVINA